MKSPDYSARRNLALDLNADDSIKKNPETQ